MQNEFKGNAVAIYKNYLRSSIEFIVKTKFKQILIDKAISTKTIYISIYVAYHSCVRYDYEFV